MILKKDYLKHAQDVSLWIQDYFENIEKLPVKSQVKPGDIYRQIPAQAPIKGEPFDQIIADLQSIIVPGITHWQHPNFHAYFPANNSVESVLAEQITAAIGAQCMLWETSPAAAELEQKMMEWLRDAMGLPTHMEGVIQDTASSATLTALLTAREVKTNFQSNLNGVPGHLRVYCSEATHSSIDKAVAICGIGRNNLVKISVDQQQSIIPEALEKAIVEDLKSDKLPCAVVATLGSTSTLAVDALGAIAEICKKYDVWLHVDAAYAGSALLLSEYRWMIEGAESMDSFVFNPHKWIFTQFDCSAYFVKNAEALIKTFEISPEYLKTKHRGVVNDYRDWGIALGRRFRALKLWFVLRSYGIEGIQSVLRNHIALNEYFVQELLAREQFELTAPSFLNMSCIRLKPTLDHNLEQENNRNINLLHHINEAGKIYLTKTKVNDKIMIRIVFGQTYLMKKHVDLALDVLHEAADKCM